jgi:hypothetical protein
LGRAAAAQYLGISVDSLDRITQLGHIRRRVLPGTRCIRFDISELDRFVEQTL